MIILIKSLKQIIRLLYFIFDKRITKGYKFSEKQLEILKEVYSLTGIDFSRANTKKLKFIKELLNENKVEPNDELKNRIKNYIEEAKVMDDVKIKEKLINNAISDLGKLHKNNGIDDEKYYNNITYLKSVLNEMKDKKSFKFLQYRIWLSIS